MRRLSLRTFGLGLSIAGFPLVVLASPTEPGQLVNALEPETSCATCHAFPNIAPHTEDTQVNPWAFTGTMMGNSARDPVFWAALALADQDAPGETEICVRCHAPRAFLDNNGSATSIDELTVAEREGISCDFCHRSIWDGMTEAGNAQYQIDDVLADGFRVAKRGPWTYEENEHQGHPYVQDNSFLSTSRLCGTCHDVTTIRERVDDNGDPMGFPFNEQRTYSEWLNSDFANPMSASAATCQDCHMPAIEDAAGCVDFNSPDKFHAEGARKHDLVGANRFMIGILGEDYGTTADDDPYTNAITNLDAFLPTAATMEVTFPETVDLNTGIDDIPVRVTNESGHKLPTGYSEGRVMWLEVVGRYAGEVVYSSGLWTPEDLSIEDDPQVRRYEAIAEDADDGTQLHLLRNNRWLSDTRIPPRGLSEDIQTDPVNADYVSQSGTWQHWDDVDYSFDATEFTEIEGADPELELTVRLLYLINNAEYIDHLADVNITNSAGEDLAARFEAAGNATPMVIAEQTATLPLTGLLPIPTGETGETGETGAADDTGETTTETQTETDEDSATSGDTSDNGNGGCDCRADREGAPGSAAFGLFGVLWWRRRRSG